MIFLTEWAIFIEETSGEMHTLNVLDSLNFLKIVFFLVTKNELQFHLRKFASKLHSVELFMESVLF